MKGFLLLGAIFIVSFSSLTDAQISFHYQFQAFTITPASANLNIAPKRNDLAYLTKTCDELGNKCAGFDSSGNFKSSVSGATADPTGSSSLYIKVQGENVTIEPVRLWPLPKNYKYGKDKVGVDSNWKLATTSTSGILQRAFDRYSKLIFSHQSELNEQFPAFSSAANVNSLKVSISSTDETLQLGTDESYQLSITAQEISITSKTVFGALRGLETLSQLIRYDFNEQRYAVALAPWSIQDSPSFIHRGLMIDTSRHFQPLRILRRLLDSMSYAKLNVLHWHIVDAQSFPMESKKYPKLWEGSWSVTERYTQSDIINLVKYAKDRGIRVVPELDGPGHAYAWGVGYPELLPAGWETASRCQGDCPAVPHCVVPLDPTSPLTYPLLDGLMTELKDVFEDGFFHLGGDEVQKGCWSNSARIAKYIAKKNMTLDGLYKEFVQKAHDFAFKNGKSPVNWEEVYNYFGNSLDKRVIIHAWLSAETVKTATSNGYRSILSNGKWYLDHLANTWIDYFVNDPIDGITNPEQRKLVLGGECAMWGERMDASNIFRLIWPKAGGMAERLWNYETANGMWAVEKALPRFRTFRCLLTERGIDADPVYTQDRPYQPGSCFDT